MVTQNLGSFSSPASHVAYDVMARSEPNAFMQVHRYLDPGAHIRVCRGPMDILCADAIREMLDRRFDKPALLAETGGVLAHHAGPTEIYDVDRGGMFLHDAIFAPFFAGGAGTGCMWHWGQQYVDRWNLWWHYGRFAKAVKGLDPAEEAFVPFHFETTFWRVLGLRGKKTTVLWARDIENTWENELVKGIAPTETRSSELLPYRIAAPVEWYLPFEDRTITVKPIVWRTFDRESLTNKWYSCCAYAVPFAKELQDALHVPVGLVCAYSGSTPIETWIPCEGFAARADLKDYLDLPRIPPEKWNDKASSSPRPRSRRIRSGTSRW